MTRVEGESAFVTWRGGEEIESSLAGLTDVQRRAKLRALQSIEDDIAAEEAGLSVGEVACEICGHVFRPRRSTARYCSALCRKRAERRLKARGGKPT